MNEQENPHRHFGKFLAKLRLESKLSQEGAANAMRKLGYKISQGSVAQYERGAILPSPANLQALSKVYDYNYRKLVIELVKHKYGVDLSEKAQKWI